MAGLRRWIYVQEWNRYQDHCNRCNQGRGPFDAEVVEHCEMEIRTWSQCATALCFRCHRGSPSIVKHTWRSEEGENGGEDASQESDCRHTTRSVQLESVDDVVERGLEDHQEPGTNQDGTDTWSAVVSQHEENKRMMVLRRVNRRNPCDVLLGGPTENEETAGKKNATEHHGG